MANAIQQSSYNLQTEVDDPSKLTSAKRRWCYLIANQISFSNHNGYSIHMPRPGDELLYLWLKKIISSDQTAVIFVEHLSFSDEKLKVLQQLCQQYTTRLINLNSTQITKSDNIVFGPW